MWQIEYSQLRQFLQKDGSVYQRDGSFVRAIPCYEISYSRKLNEAIPISHFLDSPAEAEYFSISDGYFSISDGYLSISDGYLSIRVPYCQ